MLLKLTLRMDVKAWNAWLGQDSNRVSEVLYLCGSNEFKVKGALLSQCINKVDRLLPLNLAWYMRDNGLNLKHNLQCWCDFTGG